MVLPDDDDDDDDNAENDCNLTRLGIHCLVKADVKEEDSNNEAATAMAGPCHLIVKDRRRVTVWQRLTPDLWRQ
jgi:hypothetical protein